jgi:predicted enzyme related to lactoylglutathione lyase
MPPLSLVILYVDDPRASVAFYANLLDLAPVEESDTFALLPLSSGVALALWSRHTVEPRAEAAGGGTELAFKVEDVDAVRADWTARGLPVLQAPTDMDFGRTFVALDPDGHRLRVYRLATG